MINKYEIQLKAIFFKIFPEKTIMKKDLALYGFNYNQLFRSGIILKELNKKFEQEFWTLNPKTCLSCKKHFFPSPDQTLFEYRIKKFCNRSCSATFNGKMYPKRIAHPKKVSFPIFSLKETEKKCHWCLTPCNNLYCTQKCAFDAKYCSKFLDWYLKLTEKHYNKLMRKYLADIYGYQCDNHRLGKKCYTKLELFPKLVLEVDHIDGNHENNAPSNVRLLCPSCHMMTDTFTSKNKGNGREYRRIRYAEGKSS